MMLLDASAVLGVLQAEPGWEMVESEITSGQAILNVVNQAEVLSKLCEWGMDWGQLTKRKKSYVKTF